jgi:hypothetical protein
MLPREPLAVKLTIEIIQLNNEIRFQLQKRRRALQRLAGRVASL